jgi:Zn-dependent protease
MFSSKKIGRFYDIDVYVHPTFYLLIAWIVFAHMLAGETVGATVSGVIFVLLIFVCVVLHEYGHALTARKFNVKTRDITLYPIGGVARLEKMPEEPIEELWVALAGPAVNVVIAIGLAGWLAVSRSFVPVDELTLTSGSMVERLMIVNIFLVVFNLLPAFPMDGGRVLRAILAHNMDYVQATQIAAQIGKGMALLFGFAGFFVSPILLFIAFFVWIGASGEASQVQIRQLLRGVPLSDVLITDYEAVSPGESLDQLRERFVSGNQSAYPVVEEGAVVGIVTQQQLVEQLHGKTSETPVREIMQTDVVELDVHDMLEPALQKLQEAGQSIAPVMDDGRIAGIVTDERTGRFLMFRSGHQRAESAR